MELRFGKFITRLSTFTVTILFFGLTLFSLQISYSIIQKKLIIEHQSLQLKIQNIILSEFSKFNDVLLSIGDKGDEKTSSQLLEQFDWITGISVFDSDDAFNPKLEIWKKPPPQLFNKKYTIKDDILIFPLRAASANLQNRLFYGKVTTTGDDRSFLVFVISEKNANAELNQVVGWLDLNIFLNEISGRIPNNVEIEVFENLRPDLSEDFSWTGETLYPKFQYKIIPLKENETNIETIDRIIFSDGQIIRIIGVNILLWIALLSLWREHLERLKIEKKSIILSQKIDEQAKLASIGEIASAVAHEINQPLATIETYATIGKKELRKFGKNQSLEEILEKIQSQTERCARIMKSILSLKAKKRMKLEKLSFAIIEDNIKNFVETKAKSNNITVKWNVDRRINFYGDITSVEQILLNVCNNGIEAMEDTLLESRILEVSNKTNERNNSIDVIISDNGCGVEAGRETDIFKPFVSTKELGTGIGLSLCKSLLEKTGGKINLRKKISGGTEFIISFPSTRNIPKILGSIENHNGKIIYAEK